MTSMYQSKSRALSFLAISSLGASGCFDSKPSDAEPNRGSNIPAVEARIHIKAALTSVGEREVVDGDGRVWTVVGPVKYTDATVTSEVRTAIESGPRPFSNLQDITAEALAERIRPIRIQDGVQYTLRDAPLETARLILQMYADGRPAPPTSSSEGEGGRIQSLPADGLSPKWVLHSPEARYHDNPTTNYPQRATGRWTGPQCTAFFIGPRTVLTAAHCLYDRSTHSWPNPGKLVPGKDGASEPWGQWPIVTYYIPTAYITDPAGGYDYDYGVADLDIAPGYTGAPGWYAMVQAYNNPYNPVYGRLNGYPETHGGGTEQWHSYSGSINGQDGARWQNNVDATAGDSGGCLMWTSSTSLYSCAGVVSNEAQSGSARWNETRGFFYDMSLFIGTYSNAW